MQWRGGWYDMEIQNEIIVEDMQRLDNIRNKILKILADNQVSHYSAIGVLEEVKQDIQCGYMEDWEDEDD